MNDTPRLLRFCTIVFVLLTITIGIEGKSIPYQFSRLYSFGVILAGYGLLRLLRTLLTTRRIGRYGWFAFPVILFMSLALSPFTRYVYHSGSVVLMAMKGPEAFDAYYEHSRSDDAWTVEGLRKIGEYVKSRREEKDKLFVASGVGGLVYYNAGYVPDFKIYHSCFIIAPFAPEEWRDSTRSHLLEERPRFIVLDHSDRMPSITGTLKTANVAIRELPGVDSLLTTGYTLALETKAFELYERK